MDKTMGELLAQISPKLVQVIERSYGLAQRVEASAGERRALDRVGMRASDLLDAFSRLQQALQ